MQYQLKIGPLSTIYFLLLVGFSCKTDADHSPRRDTGSPSRVQDPGLSDLCKE